jgi:hypothetical protein
MRSIIWPHISSNVDHAGANIGTPIGPSIQKPEQRTVQTAANGRSRPYGAISGGTQRRSPWSNPKRIAVGANSPFRSWSGRSIRKPVSSHPLLSVFGDSTLVFEPEQRVLYLLPVIDAVGYERPKRTERDGSRIRPFQFTYDCCSQRVCHSPTCIVASSPSSVQSSLPWAYRRTTGVVH